MNIEHTIDLNGDPNSVWSWVTTIEKVADCIPGIEDMQKIDENKKYKALATDRVGPFKVSFPMDLTVEELNQPLMILKAGGQDKITKTHAQIEMVVKVEPAKDFPGTTLSLKVELQMKGKLATLGKGMIIRKFTEKVEAFTENLTEVLEGGKQDARSI